VIARLIKVADGSLRNRKEEFKMVFTRVILILLAIVSGFTFACSRNPTNSRNNIALNQAAQSARSESPSELPAEAFKAEITLIDPLAKLRPGQKETLRIKVKNASQMIWWARGGPINTRPDNKFYIAVGNRWLKSDGSLLTNMDGRYGIGKDLKSGEEIQLRFCGAAHEDPGNYVLIVDLGRQQVAWFSDRARPPAKTKITVER